MKQDINQFKTLYEELLLNIPKKLKNKLCVFFPQVGKNYFDMEDKILFIGKSVNSWVTNELDIEKLFDYKNSERIINRDDEIFWVERNDNPHYNSNTSAFWRLIKKITIKHFKENDWYNKIAWTNLYKVSPWEGGNPDAFLKKLQSNLCIKILNKEIEYFDPNYVIFLTSDWETFYLKQIGFNYSNNKVEKWDKYKTYYQLFNKKTFLLSQHPQGKKEKPHIKTILKIIEK